MVGGIFSRGGRSFFFLMGHLFYPFWRSPYCTSMYIKFYWLRGSKLARTCLVTAPFWIRTNHRCFEVSGRVNAPTPPNAGVTYCFRYTPPFSSAPSPVHRPPMARDSSVEERVPRHNLAMASRPEDPQAPHALDPRGPRSPKCMASSLSLGAPKHPAPFLWVAPWHFWAIQKKLRPLSDIE